MMSFDCGLQQRLAEEGQPASGSIFVSGGGRDFQISLVPTAEVEEVFVSDDILVTHALLLYKKTGTVIKVVVEHLGDYHKQKEK